MPQFRTKQQACMSRVPHWICKSCGTVFTKTKPGICTHCRASHPEYTYFPSRREYNRYKELKMMELAGLIDAGSLELQPVYEITTTQKVTFDYRYTVHGRQVIEDAKTPGTNTTESKRKRRAVEEQHGIEVKLV